MDIEGAGKARQGWLQAFLGLPHGIPSHDTFGRFFAALDAEAFQRAFMRWSEGVSRVSKGQVIGIDGKTMRRSHDQGLKAFLLYKTNPWSKVAILTHISRE